MAPRTWAVEGFVAALRDPALGMIEEHLSLGLDLDLWRALRPRAVEIAPLVAKRLGDADWNVRAAAARALGALGAKERAGEVAALLADPDGDVRAAAAEALGALGARERAGEVAALLADPDGDVRGAAARALGALGAKERAGEVAALLADPESYVRGAAAEVLGALGAKEEVAALLADPESYARWAAVKALGTLGARERAGEVAALLANAEGYKWLDVVRSLLLLGEHNLPVILQAAATTYTPVKQRVSGRLLAHVLGGGRVEVETLLRWVAGPSSRPSVQAGADREEMLVTLQIFASAWPHTEAHRPLREDLANQIAAVVGRSCPGPGTPTVAGGDVGGRVRSLLTGSLESLAGLIGAACWGTADRSLLADLAGDLRAAGFDEADTAEKAVAGIDRRDVIGRGVLAGGGHLLFWGLLLGLYPWRWARPVRAFFFWNPWPRRIFGFGYVGVVLAYVPWLRRLLFVPYRRSLLADAELDHFNERAYFAGSRVCDEHGAEVLLDAAIPTVEGQTVLVGDSGLGKSMFLRRLAKRSRRIAVYLPARRCEGGVIEAVQAKLPGLAGDPDFLRQLVSAGAVDVIIDGLNEVSAETRGKITDFVERHFEGNIVLATQPMEWRKPTNARTFRLLPLARDEIEAFLVSREAELPSDAPLKGEAFVRAARVFLARAFDSRTEEAERLAMQRALANPMDLVTVAQILAKEREPDLLALQEQSYALVAEDYAATNQGAAFPLERFAEHVYALRLQDSKAPSEAEFPNEVAALERQKMLVRRVGGDRQGPVVFRHDKVMEFFLYHAFVGQDRAERQVKHVDDPRFRGVYLMMALRLPLAEAQALREFVQDHAVDSGDHSLGDEFWRLLRARSQRPAPARAAA